jgi:hypothetical protein
MGPVCAPRSQGPLIVAARRGRYSANSFDNRAASCRCPENAPIPHKKSHFTVQHRYYAAIGS